MITDPNFSDKRLRSEIYLNCDFCNSAFTRIKKNLMFKNAITTTIHFCSKECEKNYRIKMFYNEIYCLNCEASFISHKSKNRIFCKKSCAATYNNKNKSHGTRRSKLEEFLEVELTKVFSNLEIHFNRKDAINSELDIYIPSLRLAFELNGIFHYEPIYGPEKLSQIQNNDNRKFQACIERGIEICIIDSSKLGYFKLEKAREFLNIICDIIGRKM